MSQEQANKEKLAYELSVKLYDWTNRRIESVNGTIASFAAWITGANLALITLVAKLPGNPSRVSPCMVGWAIGLLFIFNGLAIYIKAKGNNSIPEKFTNPFAGSFEQKFADIVIENTKKHFDENLRLAKWKECGLSMITVLAFVQLILAICCLISLARS
jgi:hypothetical protein